MATSIVNNRLSHYHPAQSAPLLVKPACRSGREGIKKLVPLLSKEGVGGGLIIIATFFLFLNPAHAGLILQHPTYTGLNQGLVGYWSFDGKDMAGVTAYDRSGQGNNGTLTNGPTRTAGKIGQALSFDGSNDYVSVGDNDSMDITGSITVATWVRATSFGVGFNEERLVFKGTGVSTENIYTLGIADSKAMFSLHLAGFGGSDCLGNSPCIVSNTTLVTGRWHHVAGTYDGATIRIYVDGQLGGSQSVVSTGTADANPVLFGSRPDGQDSLTGFLDDVRVYNRALSGDEIKRLYKIGATLKVNTSISNDSLKKGLVGWWSFDGNDMAGVTAFDRSGQGNNGTLTNGPTRTAGKIGQGLSFDGSNDYVTAIDKGGLDNISQVSISLWIKLNHLASARGLHNAMITKLHSADPWISYEIFQYSVNDHILMEVINSSGTIKYADGPASIILGINTWYHVVGTYNGSNMMVYVNGTSGTPVAQTGTVYDSDSALKIGSDWTTYDDGLIDDVRIYNRALSSDEIKRLYNLGR